MVDLEIDQGFTSINFLGSGESLMTVFAFRYRGFSLLSLAFGSLLFSIGCSPSQWFSGANQDAGVKAQKSDRQVNPSCSGLNLSQPTLDVFTFRKIVGCFNSDGSIDPIARMSDRLSDAELKPLVSLVNEHIVENKKALFELEHTFNLLDRTRKLDPTLYQVGRLLENDEFVASGIRLLKRVHRSEVEEKTQAGKVLANPIILKSIERLSKKLTVAGVQQGLDVAIQILEAPSVEQIQNKIRSANPRGDRRDFERELVQPVLDYVVIDGRDPQQTQVVLELIQRLIDGKMFRVLDEVLEGGSSKGLAQDLRVRVPALVSLLDFTLDEKYNRSRGPLMDPLASLFHAMNGPMVCLKGAQSVPNAGLFVVDELLAQSGESASLVQRRYPLTLKLMGSVCEFKPELSRDYWAFTRLSQSSAWQPTVDLLKALDREDLTSLFLNILGNTGSGFAGGPVENTAGIKRLLPLLQEVTERGLWEDLLYFATLPQKQDRKALIELLEYIMEPAPELGGKSLYDVGVEIVSRVKAKDLVDFLMSVKPFLDQKEPLVAPALRGLRDAFYSSDAHPMLELTQAVLASASKSPEFYEFLFKVSELDEFNDSVKLISKMAKGSELRELLTALMTLYHSFAVEGSHPIAVGETPAMPQLLRHTLSSNESVKYKINFEQKRELLACTKLDFENDLLDSRDPAFREQLHSTLSCLNSDREFDSLEKLIKKWSETPIEGMRSETLLSWGFELMKGLPFDATETGQLMSSFWKAYENGDVKKSLDLVRLLGGVELKGSVSAENRPTQGTVAAAAWELIFDLYQKSGSSLRRLSDFGAEVLENSKNQELLKFAERLFRAGAIQSEAPFNVLGQVDLVDLKSRIRKYECRDDSNEIKTRTQSILKDAEESIGSWEWDEKN